MNDHKKQIIKEQGNFLEKVNMMYEVYLNEDKIKRDSSTGIKPHNVIPEDRNHKYSFSKSHDINDKHVFINEKD